MRKLAILAATAVLCFAALAGAHPFSAHAGADYAALLLLQAALPLLLSRAAFESLLRKTTG